MKSCFFVLLVKHKKILGIDYGDFSIGLAVFDLENDFIYPLKTIFRHKANVLRASLREIVEIVLNEGICKIVVGLPLNFDGSEGDRVEKVKAFAKMLDTKVKSSVNENGIEPIEIEFQDERLTTVEAKQILSERGVKISEQKKVLDQVAAEIILGDYRQKLKARKE